MPHGVGDLDLLQLACCEQLLDRGRDVPHAETEVVREGPDLGDAQGAGRPRDELAERGSLVLGGVDVRRGVIVRGQGVQPLELRGAPHAVELPGAEEVLHRPLGLGAAPSPALAALGVPQMLGGGGGADGTDVRHHLADLREQLWGGDGDVPQCAPVLLGDGTAAKGQQPMDVRRDEGGLVGEALPQAASRSGAHGTLEHGGVPAAGAREHGEVVGTGEHAHRIDLEQLGPLQRAGERAAAARGRRWVAATGTSHALSAQGDPSCAGPGEGRAHRRGVPVGRRGEGREDAAALLPPRSVVGVRR